MPDLIDAVQAQTEAQLENALLHHACRARPVGLAACENQDCGESISELRQGLGARLCIGCAKDAEAQSVHFRSRER